MWAGGFDAGVERQSLDVLLKTAERAGGLGIPALALFPVVDTSLKSGAGAGV